MNNKICPLFLAVQLGHAIDCHCIGDACAWYVPPVCAPNGKPIAEGRCAVQALGVLPELVKGVRSL